MCEFDIFLFAFVGTTTIDSYAVSRQYEGKLLNDVMMRL